MTEVLKPDLSKIAEEMLPDGTILKESGLVVPNNMGKVTKPESSGEIELPGIEDIMELTNSDWSVPGDLSGSDKSVGAEDIVIPGGDKSKVTIPDGDTLMELSKRDVEKTGGEKLSVSELAVAFGNFEVFFDRQFEKRFPNINKSYDRLAASAGQRIAETKTFYDKTRDIKETRTTTHAGPVEAECIVALEIAGKQELQRTVVANKALERAKKLLFERRMFESALLSNYAAEVNEMPELVTQAREALRKARGDRQLKFSVYEILAQVKMSQSEASAIGIYMAESRDLGHPLAYKLLLLADPESAFGKQQAERREMLLSLLNGSPQEMFNMYEDLRGLASGVVCSMDIHNPPNARVGVEFEYGKGADFTYVPGFRHSRDGGNQEISRRIHETHLDQQYLRDLSSLHGYFRDTAGHVSSLHIHFDRKMHPVKPRIGELLGNKQDQKYDYGATVRKSWRLPTWEVRGLVQSTHPAKVADAIQLYVEASSKQNSEDLTPIKIDAKQEPTVEQIIFTHICRHVSSPEGRLAALKMLEHPLMLKAVNPISLIQGYDKTDKEGLRKVYEAMQKGLHGSYVGHRLKEIASEFDFPFDKEKFPDDLEIYQDFEYTGDIFADMLEHFDEEDNPNTNVPQSTSISEEMLDPAEEPLNFISDPELVEGLDSWGTDNNPTNLPEPNLNPEFNPVL